MLLAVIVDGNKLLSFLISFVIQSWTTFLLTDTTKRYCDKTLQAVCHSEITVVPVADNFLLQLH